MTAGIIHTNVLSCRTKHGSDSETYDTEGRYVPQKFEEFFSKCAPLPAPDSPASGTLASLVLSMRCCDSATAIRPMASCSRSCDMLCKVFRCVLGPPIPVIQIVGT